MSSSTHTTRVMVDLEHALERAHSQNEAAHREANDFVASAYAEHEKLIRSLGPKKDSLHRQMQQLKEKMKELEGRLDGVASEIADSQLHVEKVEAHAAARRRLADEKEEKDSEWAESMASAPAASQAIWERGLNMLQCHRDGVPTLLGLSVIAMAKYRVPVEDPQPLAACLGPAGAAAAVADAAVVRGSSDAGRSRVHAGLLVYIDKLQQWAEPKLMAAAREAEEVQRQAKLEADRAATRAAARAAAQEERARALTDIEYYQALVRSYFPHAISHLPVPPDAGVSENDWIAHQRWQLQQTKELLNRLRQRQVAKSGNRLVPEEQTEPDELCCGISKELFRFPLTGRCGHSFERAQIRRWMGRAREKPCPLCRAALTKEGLRLNVGLQAQAAEWRQTSAKLCRAAGKKRARTPTKVVRHAGDAMECNIARQPSSDSDDDHGCSGLVRPTYHPHKLRLSAAVLELEDSAELSLKIDLAPTRQQTLRGEEDKKSSEAAGSSVLQMAEAAETGVHTEDTAEEDEDDQEEHIDEHEASSDDEATPPSQQRRRLTPADGECWRCMCGYVNEGRHCVKPLRSGSLCGLTRKMGVHLYGVNPVYGPNAEHIA